MKLPIRRGIKRGIRRGIVAVSSAPLGPSVADQAFDYGLLSAPLAGAKTIAPTSGTITGIVIDSGNTGTVYDTTGAQIRLAAGKTAATLTLGCTATFSDLSTDTFTATITATANTAHVYGTSVSDNTQMDAAILAWDAATTETITIRQNAITDGVNINRVDITGDKIINGETTSAEKTDWPQVAWVYADRLSATGTYTMSYMRLVDHANTPVATKSPFVFDGPADSTIVHHIACMDGPFIPANWTNRDLWPTIDYDTLVGSAPVVGETFTDGANVALCMDVDDNGDGTGTAWFSDKPAEKTGDGAEGWLLAATITGVETPGTTFAVAVVQYGGLPTNVRYDAFHCNAGTDQNDISITYCYSEGFTAFTDIRAIASLTVQHNSGKDFYGDVNKLAPVVTGAANAPDTIVSDNIFWGQHATGSHVGNPHSDMLQVAYGNILNLITFFFVDNNIFGALSAMGKGTQNVFLAGVSNPHIKARIRNNLLCTQDSTHGISVDWSEGSIIQNNTVINENYPDAGDSSVTLAIGLINDNDIVDNWIRRNVCESFRYDDQSFDGAQFDSNVILGKGGATLSYASVFANPQASQLTSVAELLAGTLPLSNGPLMAGATWASTDDGCVNSSGEHVPYVDPTTIGLWSGKSAETGETTGKTRFYIDWLNGATTAYIVYVPTNNEPSKAQIIAGQDHTGSAAASSSNVLLTDIGAINLTATGLTSSTDYYVFAVASGTTDSNILSCGNFTTAATLYEVVFGGTAYASVADVGTDYSYTEYLTVFLHLNPDLLTTPAQYWYHWKLGGIDVYFRQAANNGKPQFRIENNDSETLWNATGSTSLDIGADNCVLMHFDTTSDGNDGKIWLCNADTNALIYDAAATIRSGLSDGNEMKIALLNTAMAFGASTTGANILEGSTAGTRVKIDTSEDITDSSVRDQYYSSSTFRPTNFSLAPASPEYQANKAASFWNAVAPGYNDGTAIKLLMTNTVTDL